MPRYTKHVAVVAYFVAVSVEVIPGRGHVVVVVAVDIRRTLL